jgi:hypothetical protein
VVKKFILLALLLYHKLGHRLIPIFIPHRGCGVGRGIWVPHHQAGGGSVGGDTPRASSPAVSSWDVDLAKGGVTLVVVAEGVGSRRRGRGWETTLGDRTGGT